ncbi:hypothetical protein [Rhodonellum sp.]|uniref:hypothetical protein n=1 Tax=Rhodonellum sp. TaxID=2231180 RepID=UPI00271BEA52|nr:hypothetical protein [Rhodonellum sp.]MDO9553434.1 hypothetical protein [Rhodonellum sp.]
MKEKIFLLILFLFQSIPSLWGQEKISNSFEERGGNSFMFGLDFQGYQPLFLGHNFLAKSYRHHPGFLIDSRMGIQDFVGVGLSLGKNVSKVEEFEILGNDFDLARFRQSGVYIYYQHLIGRRMNVEPRIGYGLLSVKHSGPDDFYRLRFEQFFSGVNVNLAANSAKSLIFHGGIQYALLSGVDIVINPEDKKYITKSNGLQFSFGMRLEFHGFWK